MTEVALTIFIIVVLIAINGIFVAAEFALVMAPRAAIERLAEKGSRVAAALRGILNDALQQDRCIATSQLGITAASLGLGMYGEHQLAEWIHHGLEQVGAGSWARAHIAASFLSILILTYLHIVLGEMVPKSLALQQPATTALWLLRPVQVTQYLMFPLVILLAAMGNGILRLMGVQRQSAPHDRYYTADELQFVVRESQQGGLLRAESSRVFSDLLEFGEITAGEVMVPRTKAVGIPLGASPEDIRRVTRDTRHTRYPVFQGDLDHILGVIHLKALFQAFLSGRSIDSEMIRPVRRVPEGLPLDRVLEAMRSAGTQIVVVMDEFGGTAGILTMEDLFEEVVGEIEGPDDLDSPPEIFRDELGNIIVAGEVPLFELGEHLGIDLEHKDVDSVSGLILLLLGRPADLGDAIEFEGFRFEVIELAGHGVETCRIHPKEDIKDEAHEPEDSQ